MGREEECAAVEAALRRERLVTLTGPGGIGKTRLAIEVAGKVADAFAGGVWFVGLASLSDPGLIPGAIADVLALPRSPAIEPLEQVAAFLKGRDGPTLLVLDNFEHLVEEGAAVVKILAEGVPRLTCLVTSRQVLDLDGEREFAVPPLPTPGEGNAADVADPDETARLIACPSVHSSSTGRRRCGRTSR